MADDAAVDLVIDDAAVDAIAREFRVEDRELLLRCLVEAATAYRDNAEPALSEGLREIKRFHVALDRAVARWNELPPTTLETLAFHAAFTSSPGVGVAWRDVELDDSGEPTDDDPYPGVDPYLAEIAERMDLSLRDLLGITDEEVWRRTRDIGRPAYPALVALVEVIVGYWTRDLGRRFTVYFGETDKPLPEPTSETARFVDRCTRAIGCAQRPSALRTVMRTIKRTYKNYGRKQAG